MRPITFIMILFFAGYTSAALDKRELLKRKADLTNQKSQCEKMPDIGMRDACMLKYQKAANKYKADLAKFKQSVVLESQKRQERRGNESGGDLVGDIQKRQENIKQFSDFINSSCVRERTENCATALFQLGNLTYKNEEDDFRIKQTKFEKDIQKWEDFDKKGPEPVAPKRNHTSSLQVFDRLYKEYPTYKDMPNVYFRMAFIYSIQGNDNRAYEFLSLLVTKYPTHALAIPAHLRIGEHFLLERKYRDAIKHYEQVPEGYSGVEAGLALYHKAECYYNMADFETAAKFYYEYVMKADAGTIRGDLRNEALEFMAACWADMDNGVEVAYEFLRSKGHPWEKDLYYEMGVKNKAHDRLDQARMAFEHLLNIDPTYPKAPVADMTTVEILLLGKKPMEAQEARLALVGRYQPGSDWYKANGGNKEAVEEAKIAVKKAVFQIPIYYHGEGSKDKENPNVDLLTKAETYYKEFLSKYKEDSWDIYEVHQNLGAIYQLLKKFESAAGEYKWCASTNISGYGKIPPEKSKTLLTQEDAAYNQVFMLDLERLAVLKANNDNHEAAYGTVATRNYLAAVEGYMRNYGKSNSAPDIAYNAAYVHYHAKEYKNAVGSLQGLIKDFPNHKHTNIILSMLAKSLLENGQFKESEATYTQLLGRTPVANKDEYGKIQLAISSTVFKQAEAHVKKGERKEAALLYLGLVRKYKDVEIADKALFEAGLQYEEDGDIYNSTLALLRIHTEYPKSSLKIKSILRAASVYRKGGKYRDAARTFLIIRDSYSTDSLGFQSIGFAAEALEQIPDKAGAALTYETSFKHYPQHLKTPGFLWNAGQTYEDIKDYDNAIRIYQLLGDKYPNSSYSLEAIFSVPIIQQKQGRYAEAAKSYEVFIGKYNKDVQKLVRAQLAAAILYADRLNKEPQALALFKSVKKTYEENKNNADIPAAIPAEAAYRCGQIYYQKVEQTNLNSTQKENDKRLKDMSTYFNDATECLTFAAEQSEQQWTLKAFMRMGDLVTAMGNNIKNRKIDTKDRTEFIGNKVQLLRDIPKFYDRAKSLYQKNLDLAREQGIKDSIIDSTAAKYFQSYWDKGQTFEEMGKLLATSPIPEELTPEQREDFKAKLDDFIFQFEQEGAKPVYATALKAAQFYRLENLPVNVKIKERLSSIDPQAEELKLEQLPEFTPDQQFVDNVYKGNMEKINGIFKNAGMSDNDKIKKLQGLEAEAKKEIDLLNKELKAIKSLKAPSASSDTK